MPLHPTRTQSRRLADINPYPAVQSARTQNQAQINEPPSGTCIPARRFLGRTQKREKQHIPDEGFIHLWSHTAQYDGYDENKRKQLPLPDSLLNSNWYAYPFTKTFLAFAFHSNLRDFSLTTSLNQPQYSEKPLLMMSTNSQCSFSRLMTFSLSLTTPIMCT